MVDEPRKNETETQQEPAAESSETAPKKQGKKPLYARRKFATIKHPTIQSIIDKLLRFDTKEQVETRLNAIKKNFTLSTRLPNPGDTEHSLQLWVKDFAVTEQEKKDGYKGNFMHIRPEKLEDGKITLAAYKLDIALHHHPQKKMKKTRHPNWGHPKLREVKKDKIYETIDEARAVLMTLHEDYPDVSIPLKNKLYIMIYSKQTTPPVRKYVLEIHIKDKEKGGFYISHDFNTYEPKTPKKQDGEDKKKTVKGFFSSMVELKKK